jgi:hypothetical protein
MTGARWFTAKIADGARHQAWSHLNGLALAMPSGSALASRAQQGVVHRRSEVAAAGGLRRIPEIEHLGRPSGRPLFASNLRSSNRLPGSELSRSGRVYLANPHREDLMFSLARPLLVSAIVLSVPLTAFAQPKADAGSGPTSGATSTNDAGSGPTPGAKPNTGSADSGGATAGQAKIEGQDTKPKSTDVQGKKIAP